jgi:7-cyano-7-deazaguanine synthase
MWRRSSPTFNAVVLLSGGLDSALNLALARRYRAPVMALTFDYGQRAARPEIRAAGNLCSFCGVEGRTVSLPWLRELLPVQLVEPGAPLPSRLSDVDAVWVPNRNGVFVAVGAAFAEACGARAVVAGFNVDEAAQFPDNSRSFIAASNRALRYSTNEKVKLVSYTASMSKAAIAERAVGLGLPLKYVYPCYGEGPRPCGRCASCRRTALALREAGRPELRGEIFGRRAG